MIMKRGVIAVSAFAWLQLAAAACCRSNKCLKAIALPALGQGIQDCSSLLAVTVTPAAGIITETITIVPTEHNTLVDTAVFTETVTTTAETQTQLVTIATTVTASTYTDVVTVTQTVLATETDLETVTTTLPATSYLLPVKARADTVVELASSIPSYASANCPSWDKYVSACKCAGVAPTTLTAEAPSPTTVTVSATGDAVTISVPTTISTTETVFVSATATTAATQVDTILVTATVSATESAVVSTTMTVTETVTETVTPSGPTCKPVSEVAPFKAEASEYLYNGSPMHLYANMINAVTGGIAWQLPSSSTSPAVRNKFVWKLDADGYLVLAYNVPPYAYEYVAYVGFSNNYGTIWPQVGPRVNVENSIRQRPDVYAKIKGCVNSETGELSLNAAGRTNILWCGAQMWMSFGAGEDINRGTCVKMYPKVIAA
ncbi:hypothetical protein C8A01DRAFT_36670 [Parachaetomium inaequale]|uniref:Uncharacterized protein n=1 Tax=Parachaetomium inaequale TaxID=2588326 RepID=A0AAN6PEW0_9PEZI|nr:hypothetical protein C8A01DRAFT_36670 [Parachaetomium inaequale]